MELKIESNLYTYQHTSSYASYQQSKILALCLPIHDSQNYFNSSLKDFKFDIFLYLAEKFTESFNNTVN